ncbi:hypothetical protein K439DRAFT_1665620 [Ramaria rubella]|nr:hypothetical protein K439DRAFT_1665620 [Ramaria rubella]
MHHRAALDLHPSGHPDRASSLYNLAIALQIRFDKFSDRDNLDESFVLFEHAAIDSFSSSMTRFKAAQGWAYATKSHQHSSTILAYREALNLLHRCLIATPTADLQHRLLASHTLSLPLDAAFCAIEAGQLQTAVELLDHGRAILCTQLENLATFSAFESTAFDPTGPQSCGSFDAKITLLHTIAPKFDQVVDEIRCEPAFKDFLQAVPFTTLRTAATEGPVIIVNISYYGSHAIILYHDVPVLVPLSEATPDTLHKLASDLYAALACSNIHRSNIILVLQDLWRCVVHPVTDQLQELGVAEKARIWWCPMSILCTLPIHAAGSYLPGEKNLPDMYISSYTPTLSALIQARADVTSQRADVRPAVPHLLAIGQTYQGQSGKALPRVQHELDYIGQLGIPTTVLSNEEASSATVRSKLQDHSWAHFACHGRPDVDKPFQSSFELQDNQRLTLLELIQARVPNAELAFLSACHSAAGDKRTPDESIHLAAALQFCGFRSTVGTLWAMAHDDGPLAVEEFYKYLFRQGNKPDFRDAASALNEATRAMRRKKVPESASRGEACTWRLGTFDAVGGRTPRLFRTLSQGPGTMCGAKCLRRSGAPSPGCHIIPLTIIMQGLLVATNCWYTANVWGSREVSSGHQTVHPLSIISSNSGTTIPSAKPLHTLLSHPALQHTDTIPTVRAPSLRAESLYPHACGSGCCARCWLEVRGRGDIQNARAEFRSTPSNKRL